MVNDVSADARYRAVDALPETRSELAVPLLVDDQLVGILDVQSDRTHAFGQDDRFILETLGDQVAIAIQEARLYEAEQQQAWLSTVLLQVADSMSQLSDMDAVLSSLVRLPPLLAGVDRCALILWDRDAETFTPAQSYGLEPDTRRIFEQMTFPAGAVSALDLVRWGKKPVLLRDVRDGQLLPLDLVDTLGIKELVLLPLLAQGQLLGAMMVDHQGEADSFDDRLVDMLNGIANQAAMVLHSARLVQAQQEEAYVSMALLQVSDAVSRATDLNESLSAVARVTPMLAGVQACALFLWDGQQAAFVPHTQYGLGSEAREQFSSSHLPREHTMAQQLLSGTPVTAPDELAESLTLLGGRSQSSLLALPLVARNDTLGAMVVDCSRSARHMDSRWMSILTGISGQAALAIETDHLLREAAEQERLRQELDVARRIQASFLPEACPSIPGWEVAAVWRSARQVGGDFYDFFALLPTPDGTNSWEERLGLVVADVADKGVPAALFMALSRTLMRTVAIDGRPAGDAVARVNDLILTDAPSDLFVTLFYGALQPDSGRLEYVNAGHMPPLLVRGADGLVEELRTGGMALGVLPSIHFSQQTAQLEPGDTLALYTDGVTEASNPRQEMFGRQQLIDIITANHSRSASEILDLIDAAVDDFASDAPQSDDFTLVIVKRT
jgi:serine phosphatase RsbU (regulator of sigma subunit)